MPPSDSLTQLHDPVMMRASARVGRVLREKWTLDRLLGIGGMAAVYAATHRNGKRGAVKMLHPELSADAQIRERFLREGRAANHVGHPGAVSVLDDDTAEDGSIFLVMDLLEGESLENRRERAGGRLEVVDVLSVVDQVLDVLSAAHAKGIVHRDLKPDNLFVTREGAVKVLDFGIARLRESSPSNATHTGISMGTPSYMAQEQARALWAEVDGRTDLWAIGATMFACLTGRVVHEGRTPNEQLLSAMTKTAPPVRSLAPTVPRPVAEFVDHALAFEREGRFQSAAEMQTALRVAYEAMSSAPISTAPKLVVPEIAMQKTMPSAGAMDAGGGMTGQPVVAGRTGSPLVAPAATRQALVALAVVAVLVALGAVIFFATRSSEKPSQAAVTAAASSPPIAAPSSAPPSAPAPSGGASAAPITALPNATGDTTATPQKKGAKPADPAKPAAPPKPMKRSGPVDDDL